MKLLRAATMVVLGVQCLLGGPGKSVAAQDSGPAWQNWVLNCQGCHLSNGQGTQDASPMLSGTVARFLWVPGGREYLIRVPGVASSGLTDEDLAGLVNWLLFRFDEQHVPPSFKPYTASEVARLRAHPLRMEAAQMREALLNKANRKASHNSRSQVTLP